MTERRLSPSEGKTIYWATVGLSVRGGFSVHDLSGQLRARDPDTNGVLRNPETNKIERPWGNVVEHCLVQVARVEILGEWIGLPDDIISDAGIGVFLHDFDKIEEITATKKANEDGTSPLEGVKTVQEHAELMLRNAGFSDRVIRLASAAGGYAPQLLEAQRILNQEIISNEEWAYLIIHYVDDCSVGSDWVRSRSTDPDGYTVNIIDYRAAGNKSKPAYRKIAGEIEQEFQDTSFKGMNNFDAMAVVSHQIERRFAERIYERTGEKVDPLAIPEMIDQRIKDDIERYHSKRS